MSSAGKAFKEVGNMDEMIEVLDTEPDVLVPYVPLIMTSDLVEMVEHLRQHDAYIEQYKDGSMVAPKYDVRIDGFRENDCDPDFLVSTPFHFYFASDGQHDFNHFALRDEFLLTNKRGHVFNLNTDYIRERMDISNPDYARIAMQAGHNYAVSSNKHQDGTEYVFNLHLTGRGVQFDSDILKNVSFRSPVLTGHRGTTHPLSKEEDGHKASVKHKRRNDHEEGERVNLFYGIG